MKFKLLPSLLVIGVLLMGGCTLDNILPDEIEKTTTPVSFSVYGTGSGTVTHTVTLTNDEISRVKAHITQTGGTSRVVVSQTGKTSRTTQLYSGESTSENINVNMSGITAGSVTFTVTVSKMIFGGVTITWAL